MLSSELNTPWGGCCGQLAREGGVGATHWEEAEGPGGRAGEPPHGQCAKGPNAGDTVVL